jgi:outer membrane protein insertion porin family
MGKGQELNAGINYSRYSRSVQLGFSEPYLFDRQIALGGEIYRRNSSSFNRIGGERNKSYSQTSTGLGLRLGFPVTEFLSAGTRYSLVVDKITLDPATFYRDPDGDGPSGLECDPLRAGQYLCDQLGSRVTSLIGQSVIFNNTDGIRPTRGQRILAVQDFAGLGGDVKYLRSRVDATKYLQVRPGWVVSAHLEGGYIHPLTNSPREGQDPIRLTDRFFGPQLRGFDIRGIGPRVLRTPYDLEGNLTEEEGRTSDALGGHAYYMGRLELEVPTNSSMRSLGLRPSAFVDVGSVWGLTKPVLADIGIVCTPNTGVTGGTLQLEPGALCPGVGAAGQIPGDDYIRRAGLKEEFLGNSPSPRLAIGIGVNWVSPFGPFRFDLAKALLKQRGDDTKLFSFNVGTQF